MTSERTTKRAPNKSDPVRNAISERKVWLPLWSINGSYLNAVLWPTWFAVLLQQQRPVVLNVVVPDPELGLEPVPVGVDGDAFDFPVPVGAVPGDGFAGHHSPSSSCISRRRPFTVLMSFRNGRSCAVATRVCHTRPDEFSHSTIVVCILLTLLRTLMSTAYVNTVVRRNISCQHRVQINVQGEIPPEKEGSGDGQPNQEGHQRRCWYDLPVAVPRR